MAFWGVAALALAFVSRAEPVRLGTATFREVRPACWEGISIYRDLKYGPRGDAPGEGPGYKSAITARMPARRGRSPGRRCSPGHWTTCVQVSIM